MKDRETSPFGQNLTRDFANLIPGYNSDPEGKKPLPHMDTHGGLLNSSICITFNLCQVFVQSLFSPFCLTFVLSQALK